MASLDQIKNMTWHLRGAMSVRRALLGRLLKLDEDIAHVQYELDEAWASQFDQPAEQVKEDDRGDEYDEEECSLRKRKTKKIGKGCTLKTCKRKLNLDYRDKKRAKEARACKRTKRSHTQLKGERDYGVNGHCICDEIEESAGFTSAWMERMNSEVLRLTALW